MRLLVALSLFGLLAACSGDSSSVMSAWNDGDGGSAAATGGSGGQSVAKGGSGGGVTTSTGGSAGGIGGTVTVPGGARDAQTAQCTVTSAGGGCPVDSAFLQCLKGPCGSALSAAYQGNTGPCADYASCMFNCSCGAGRSACENDCFNKAYSSSSCSPRMIDLMACWSLNNCAWPDCSSASNSVTTL
jgi:hypothetical protein